VIKPAPGDRVSIVSPCWAGPEHFPRVFDRGLDVLRSWGLEPAETPTTRRQGSPEERARDLMAAFADPSTTAVLASIGGDDQIKVVPHLDPAVFRANPKPFFGYSDNTNLLNFLALQGISSFHGGAVMVQLARAGGLHPVSEASLRAALFTTGPWEVPAPTDFGDTHGDWATDDLSVAPTMIPAEPWTWHGPQIAARGPLWGGCLEIVSWMLGANRVSDDHRGEVLLLETSEEMPSAEEVYRVLMVMGERGLLQQFAGIVVGRPKAWKPERPTAADRSAYTEAQRAAVVRALAEYVPGTPAVLGVDCGHGDPMVVMPIGGEVVLDPAAGRLTLTY
jgi:muramoyltetrapeptide carboxypeptidase LdcA involved in peptidoglycan recycling